MCVCMNVSPSLHSLLTYNLNFPNELSKVHKKQFKILLLTLNIVTAEGVSDWYFHSLASSAS